ncbi:MAG: M23 family metallopeptidase [Candidatus Komeilibacteria bacterium]|nr:M23 family metallopeptidase [Candidatus Komeilibacteria bacterium]MBT4447310.1 M23 family metallopeptidase [Candidatus Komeilibacteria bacterium]
MKKYIISILLLAISGLASGCIFEGKSKDIEVPEVIIEEPRDREEVVLIETDMTFSTISEEVGIGGTLMMNILAVSEEIYNLVKIRVGREIKFYFDKDTDEFIRLIYPIDTEEELFVEYNEEGELFAERREIEYQLKIKTAEGVIESSLYQSALDQNIDERAIIDLADVFAWTVDFGMGIRVGDTYKFIFEERYRNGEYQMPGEILAAKFVNDGKTIEGYYFSEGLDEDGDLLEGYYHPSGESVQKIFLKNPVSFKYISSGFTTGRRYVEAFNVSTGHRAIDYAAAAGTPIRSVGDGTVTFAGWNSQGYGYLTKIRHNSVFSTNYAHQSRMAVSYGQKVTQGQIIGYVGSTGFSTGPHLHFEMVKNGTKINPLTVDIPSDESIAEDKMEEFKAAITDWQKQLNN